MMPNILFKSKSFKINFHKKKTTFYVNSKSLKRQRDQRSHVKIKAAESADSALFMPYDPPYDTRVKDEYEGQLINDHP